MYKYLSLNLYVKINIYAQFYLICLFGLYNNENISTDAEVTFTVTVVNLNEPNLIRWLYRTPQKQLNPHPNTLHNTKIFFF